MNQNLPTQSGLSPFQTKLVGGFSSHNMPALTVGIAGNGTPMPQHTQPQGRHVLRARTHTASKPK